MSRKTYKFKKWQKVYIITDTAEGAKLFEGTVMEGVGEDSCCARVKFDGIEAEQVIGLGALFTTPKEAIDNAYDRIDEQEQMLAGLRVDLARLEANLKLEEKK